MVQLLFLNLKKNGNHPWIGILYCFFDTQNMKKEKNFINIEKVFAKKEEMWHNTVVSE